MPGARLCENGRDGTPEQGPGDRGAARPSSTRSCARSIVELGHGALDRHPRRRPRRRRRLADDRRAARSAPTSSRRSPQTSAALDGVTAVGVGFDVLSDEREGRASSRRWAARRAPRGRAGQGQERDLRRLRQGRRRQVDDDRQPRRRAAAPRATRPARSTATSTATRSRACSASTSKPEVNAERKIIPLDSPSGVKVMSIGFFVEENAAVVWRGPMLHKAIQQFLEDVAWDELDYLLLDLPPGTGDVSMTLAQLLPQAQVRRRHHAAAGGAVGRPPRRRDGGQGRPRGRSA